MVRPERFELPTAWFVARYSIQLSYGRMFPWKGLFELVRPERFELPTAWFVARYSIQLSYGRMDNSNVQGQCGKTVFVWCARRDSNSRPPGS